MNILKKRIKPRLTNYNHKKATIDIKKVLEDQILFGKGEFTLGEVFRIAKQECYEIIIDIIKRKR